MGFKVLVLGSLESVITRGLIALIDEMPWVKTVVQSDPDKVPDYADTSASQLATRVDLPSIVVSVASGDQSDHITLALLKKVLPLCRREDIPVIQTSTFHALGDSDPALVVPEATAPSRDAKASCCAQMEGLVAELDKRIVLRRSWIMDGTEDALFTKLVPLIRQGKPYAVSEKNFGRPIRYEVMLSAVMAVLKQVFAGAQNWGTYHILSSEKCSEAEFCDHLLRQLRALFNLNFAAPTVIDVGEDSCFMPGAASLSGNKLKEDFGIQAASWRQGFNALLKEWISDNQ